jgi:hypothetical protein
LKLAHLPARSPRALAALPSISPIPSARFTGSPDSKTEENQKKQECSAVSREALKRWGYLHFSCYGRGDGGLGNVYGHGVTGTTAPLLLMASMQFFSDSRTRRVGFPETVFPCIAGWLHAR